MPNEGKLKPDKSPRDGVFGGEHEDRRTLTEDVLYPAHAPRTESSTFHATVKAGKAADTRCVISGSSKVEYHHAFCEWAFADAVDWVGLKKIGTGETKFFKVYDPDTMQETGELIPIEHSLIWMICQFLKWRGFDWSSFDPSKPEVLVDGMYQMFPLHEKYHRAKNHGVHVLTMPIYIFQVFPKVPGYVFSPDELELKRKEV